MWMKKKVKDVHLVYCWSESHTLLQDYSTEGMSESQLKFLQHLREFGLVFQRKVQCAELNYC